MLNKSIDNYIEQTLTVPGRGGSGEALSDLLPARTNSGRGTPNGIAEIVESMEPVTARGRNAAGDLSLRSE